MSDQDTMRTLCDFWQARCIKAHEDQEALADLVAEVLFGEDDAAAARAFRSLPPEEQVRFARERFALLFPGVKR